MFGIVKMTHVCQYWRSTLISHPHLWSSIFVKNDRKDFVAACLERSREVPLTVCLDLKYGDYDDHPDCTCLRNEWSSGMRIDESNPCRYHTTIEPLLEASHIQRIRKLDVRLSMLDNCAEDGPDQDFEDALNGFGLFKFPVPALESLSFRVDHEFDVDTHLHFPRSLFFWEFLPPTKLRHLALHGCFSGPILAIRNLTSFELTADRDAFEAIELNQHTFLPFISGNPSLVSLCLSGCYFPDRAELSRVTPAKLPNLKSLRLTDIYELPGFPGLVDVPALKTISSLRISIQGQECFAFNSSADTYYHIHAENDDGFRLFCETPSDDEAVSDWLSLTHGVGLAPALVRFEGSLPRETNEVETSVLPLFVNAKVLEIGASFAGTWYRDFWKDLENVGPQLTGLRLEVIEGMDPRIGKSVKKFVEERLRKGMPLAKLERMTFEEMGEEDEGKAERLWEEFRAGLDIDQYLLAQ